MSNLNPVGALNDAYAAGVKAGREEEINNRKVDASAKQIYDELRALVDLGDLIIRQVGNGYIIRRCPYEMGGRMETWVVEGGIGEVVKQLTAIEAADVTRNAVKSELAVSATSGMSLSEFARGTRSPAPPASMRY